MSGLLLVLVPSSQTRSGYAGRRIVVDFGDSLPQALYEVERDPWTVRVLRSPPPAAEPDDADDWTMQIDELFGEFDNEDAEVMAHRLHLLIETDAEGPTVEAHTLPNVVAVHARCNQSAAYLDGVFRDYIVHGVRFTPGVNVAVQAVAGSGKTTLMLNLVKARAALRFLYISFNRSVCLEMRERAKAMGLNNVDMYTYDALAMKMTGVNLDGNENSLVLTQRLLPQLVPDTRTWTPRLKRILIELVDQYCASRVTNIDEWWTRFGQFSQSIPKYTRAYKRYPRGNVPGPGPEDLFKVMVKFWNEGTPRQVTFSTAKKTAYIMKAMRHLASKYDVVLIDESQDLNNIMVPSLVDHLHNIPKVFVGDMQQAIYQFNHCVNAFEQLPVEKTHHFELYRTFRMNTPATEFVTKTCGVTMIPSPHKTHETQVHVGIEPSKECRQYVYLCRSWRTLLRLASEAYANGERIYVAGLGERIETLKDEALEHNPKTRELLETALEVQQCTSTKESARIIFATIHAFKGCEHRAVRVAPDVKVTDTNLFYVAITRATHDLYMDEINIEA